MTVKRKFWSSLIVSTGSWHKFLLPLLLVSEQLEHRLHKLYGDLFAASSLTVELSVMFP
jgi:hypothetical protein